MNINIKEKKTITAALTETPLKMTTTTAKISPHKHTFIRSNTYI